MLECPSQHTKQHKFCSFSSFAGEHRSQLAPRLFQRRVSRESAVPSTTRDSPTDLGATRHARRCVSTRTHITAIRSSDACCGHPRQRPRRPRTASSTLGRRCPSSDELGRRLSAPLHAHGSGAPCSAAGTRAQKQAFAREFTLNPPVTALRSPRTRARPVVTEVASRRAGLVLGSGPHARAHYSAHPATGKCVHAAPDPLREPGSVSRR